MASNPSKPPPTRESGEKSQVNAVLAYVRFAYMRMTGGQVLSAGERPLTSTYARIARHDSRNGRGMVAKIRAPVAWSRPSATTATLRSQ